MRTSVLAVAALAIGCSSAKPEQPSQPAQSNLCNAGIDDGDACTLDACDPATGAVTHTFLPRAILSGSPTGELYSMSIPPTSSGGLSVCPNGPTPGATPPECVTEIDFSTPDLTFAKLTETSFQVSGDVPVRIQDLPVSYALFATNLTGSVTFTGNRACPGADQTFLPVPTTITFDTAAAPGTALSVTIEIDQATVESGLSVCETSMAQFASLLKPYAAAEVTRSAQDFVKSLVELQLCVRGPNCPEGTTVDQNGLCRFPSGLCVSRGVDSSGMPILPACLQ
jgi:hypothetical protein